MEVEPSLEDIATKTETADIRSYRSFLDDNTPGPALASRKFYKMVDPFGSSKFSDRLYDCRRFAWFIRHKETGRVRIAAKQCRLRWCYHCSEARQQFITQAVKPWFEKAARPKLLTVTLKHTDDPLDEQIAFLYKCFSKFRNRMYLKSRIRGGVWFFQVTYNKKDQQWHPHIHALLNSNYLDHSELKVLWHKITGTSNVVHIRAVHDPERTLSHNARYAARPSALIKIPEELWPTLYDAFDGRRICGTWGDAREISLRPKKPEDSSEWQSIGDFTTVYAMRNCDEDAREIWRAWMKNLPVGPAVSMKRIENFRDEIEEDIRPPPKWVTEPIFDSMSANR